MLLGRWYPAPMVRHTLLWRQTLERKNLAQDVRPAWGQLALHVRYNTRRGGWHPKCLTSYSWEAIAAALLPLGFPA
jgi:hypothetical protein